MGRNLDGLGESPQEVAAREFSKQLAARKSGERLAGNDRTGVSERTDAKPNKSYHENATVNGADINIKWDNGLDTYVIFFEKKVPGLSKDRQYIELTTCPEVAKQIFDEAVIQAGLSTDLYLIYKKVNDYFKDSEALQNASDDHDGSLKARVLAERLSLGVGGDWTEQNEGWKRIKEFAETVDTEARQDILKQALIDQVGAVIRTKDNGNLWKFTSAFQDLLGDICQSPDVKKIAIDGVSSLLKIGYIENAIDLIKMLNISSQTLEQDQNTQNYAKKVLSGAINATNSELKEFALALCVPEDFLSSEEYQRDHSVALNKYLRRFEVK